MFNSTLLNQLNIPKRFGQIGLLSWDVLIIRVCSKGMKVHNGSYICPTVETGAVCVAEQHTLKAFFDGSVERIRKKKRAVCIRLKTELFIKEKVFFWSEHVQ